MFEMLRPVRESFTFSLHHPSVYLQLLLVSELQPFPRSNTNGYHIVLLFLIIILKQPIDLLDPFSESVSYSRDVIDQRGDQPDLRELPV